MLYHMITGKELTINDLWQKNGIRETDIIEVKGQISSVIFEHQEQELPHNPYDQEVRELDSIRHGDVEMLNRSLAETYRGEVGQLAKKSSPPGEEYCHLCYRTCIPCSHQRGNDSGRGFFHGGWLHYED